MGEINPVWSALGTGSCEVATGVTDSAPKPVVAQILYQCSAHFKFSQVQLLDELYAFSDYVLVSSLLAKSTETRAVLLAAHSQIRTIFGDAAQLSIAAEQDEDAEVDLVVLVRTGLGREHDRAKLDQLDEVWWLDAIRRTPELIIDIE